MSIKLAKIQEKNMVSQWFWRANSSGRYVAKGKNAGSKIVEAPGIIF
jgi:hypothetical protein